MWNTNISLFQEEGMGLPERNSRVKGTHGVFNKMPLTGSKDKPDGANETSRRYARQSNIPP